MCRTSRVYQWDIKCFVLAYSLVSYHIIEIYASAMLKSLVIVLIYVLHNYIIHA